MASTIKFLKDKFGKKPEIFESNMKALQAGYNYGDTTETFTTTYKVEKAKMHPGVYRSIMGNQALAYRFDSRFAKEWAAFYFWVHTQ